MNEAFAAIGALSLAALPLALSAATPITVPALTYNAAPVQTATLVEADYYDEDAASVLTKRWSDRGAIYPDNTFYEARLLSRVTVSQSAVDTIGVGGRVALTVSQIELSNGDAALDTIARDCLALGRTATVKTMPAPVQSASDLGGGNLSGAATVFKGVTAGLAPTPYRTTLSLSDLSDRFNVPLQANLYGGTGGTDGSTELKGVSKPVAFGWLYNVTPVYIGLVDLGDGTLPTYQTNWRAVRAHDAVRIRGVSQTAVVTAPGIGQYRDWPSQGMYQLGSTPDGIVTCDVRGDAPSGDYAGTTATIVQRLLTALGPQLSSTDFDDASFAAVAADLSGEIGWYSGTNNVTALNAIEELLSHCGVWLAGGRNGKLRLSLASADTSTAQLTLDAYDITALSPAALPTSLLPAPQAVEVSSVVNWTPLTDIAGSVTGSARDALAGAGHVMRAASSALAARQLPANTWSLPGLFRYEVDALGRAQALSDWIAGGLRAFQVTTDRYRNQIEVGHICAITSYPRHGLSGGFSGVVAAWSEDARTGRCTMLLIG